MDRPDIHIAPPLVFMAGFITGFMMDRALVGLRLAGEAGGPPPRPLALTGVALIVLGLSLAGWGAAKFHGARTSVLPFRPATALVLTGPYRFTRNPMYAGMTLGYLGLSLVFNTAWPILLLPAVLFALTKLVITREEEYLAATFGETYEAYRRRVRRWI